MIGQFTTITRVYANGDRVQTSTTPDHADILIGYDQRFRPGCALFRNSDCVQLGYLGKAWCAEISDELAAELEPSP